ncbi:MAG: hypothetical protein JSS87_00755 [Acidobacteria bacterium]|nr:hypothetical protein [Acidobacteriota bacterium]
MRRNFIAAASLILSAAALAQAPAPSPKTVLEQFHSPAKEYRPIVRWWWPGNDVTEAELRREVGLLDNAGFGGAEIQSFRIGLPKLSEERMKRVNQFATPAFFKNVGAATDEAKKHGMYLDYTFGSGWPFGGGYDITPELASVELRYSHRTVQGPGRIHTKLDLPGLYDGDPERRESITKGLPEGWAERLEKRIKLVAVVAVRGEDPEWYGDQAKGRELAVVKSGILDKGTSIDLTSKLQPDGTLDWDAPEGTWQVFVFRSVPTVAKVVGSAGEGPQLEMDHWNKAAFEAHAKHVGDAAVPYIGQYFGNGIRAVFCDSLEVKSWFYWSDDFLAEFKKRRGYDLLPYLPIVKVQGYSSPFGGFANLPAYDMLSIGDQVRRDYWQTLSDLMIERFFDPFNTWVHNHHMLSRTQAHGAPADILRIYGESDIPETEHLYDNGRFDFLKMSASAAHVYGRSRVGSESFVWRMTTYQNTPTDFKRGADQLFAAGINAILYHGFPYRLAGQTEPGWHPFPSHGTFMNEKNTFWPYMSQFNSYLTRVQYLSQTGRNVAEVALYRYALPRQAVEPPPPPAPELNQRIMDAGYNYDHLDYQGLMQSTVRNKRLVTAGGAEYRVLVLPALPAIDFQLMEKVRDFAAAGLPVVFAGEKPSREDSLLDNANRSRQVQAVVKAMSGMKNVASATSSDTAVAAIHKITAPDVQFHSKVLQHFEKQIGGMTVFFLRNATDEPQTIRANFAAKGNVELWDAWKGTSARITTATKTANGTDITVPIGPVGSVLVVFTPEATATEDLQPPMHVAKRISLDGATWKLTATGMDPTGKDITINRTVTQLNDWAFDKDLSTLSGSGTYTTTFTAPATNKRVMLNLGDVGSVASVKVNGTDAGTLLIAPFTVDITKLIHPGENTLEVTVTNTLYNAMVQRKNRPFNPGNVLTPSGLVPSGLMGPVQLELE